MAQSVRKGTQIIYLIKLNLGTIVNGVKYLKIFTPGHITGKLMTYGILY